MWPNPQFHANLVTFTKEILNGKLHFLCSVLKWWDEDSLNLLFLLLQVLWMVSNSFRSSLRSLKLFKCLIYNRTSQFKFWVLFLYSNWFFDYFHLALGDWNKRFYQAFWSRPIRMSYILKLKLAWTVSVEFNH